MKLLIKQLAFFTILIQLNLNAQSSLNGKSILLKSNKKIKNLNSVKYSITAWKINKKSEAPIYKSVITHKGSLKNTNRNSIETKVESTITLANHKMAIDYYYNFKLHKNLAIINHSEYDYIARIEDNLISAAIMVYIPRILFSYRLDNLSGELIIHDFLNKNSTAKVLKEEIIDGDICFKIEQKTKAGLMITKEKVSHVWISKKSMMPRAFQNDKLYGRIDLIEQNVIYGSKNLKIKNPNNKPTIIKTKKDLFRSSKLPLISVGGKLPEAALNHKIFTNERLKDLKEAVIFLDFWGTWCAPCKKAMPSIQKIHDKYKGKEVIVIGVSVNDPPYYDKQFMIDNNYTYPISSSGKNLADHLNVRAYPTIYIINNKGEVLFSGLGDGKNHKVEKWIKVIDTYLNQNGE